MSSAEEIRRVHDRWDTAVKERSISDLMALYADDASFEGHAVLALFPDRKEGVLRGKTEVSKLFEISFSKPSWGMWWRSGEFCLNEKTLMWEYPRTSPDGVQLDLVEVMDIQNGLIEKHRVYWGWESINAFIESTKK